MVNPLVKERKYDTDYLLGTPDDAGEPGYFASNLVSYHSYNP